MTSELRVSHEKMLAVDEYANRVTITAQDVDDDLFSRLRCFEDDA